MESYVYTKRTREDHGILVVGSGCCRRGLWVVDAIMLLRVILLLELSLCILVVHD